MRLYVGSLSFDVTDKDLKDAFAAFGEVASATVIRDKFTGDSRGFGFVEMNDDAQARAAIDGLNGKELMGRAIVVNEAKPRTENRFGGGGGGGGRGGFGGGPRGGRDDRRW